MSSSIKIKDDVGNWIYYGGTTKNDDINWIAIKTSTQVVPAKGGYYSIVATNDQRYVFVILPAAPANGTIVGVQVIDNPTTYVYLQSSGTDTIDYQISPILARSNAQTIERIRYCNGRWFRLDGNYNYTPPPTVGPYQITPLSTALPEVIVNSGSSIALSSGFDREVTCSSVTIYTY